MMTSDKEPDISDEKLEEIDEIVTMMDEGESGTTSQGTKVEKMDEKEWENKELYNILLFILSYVSIPILLIMVVGVHFFGVYPTVGTLTELVPLVVTIIVFKLIVDAVTSEPWHGVLYSHVRWYQWWWRI